MEEAVELALKYQRERCDNLRNELDNFRTLTNKRFETIEKWDRWKMVGFILIGLFLSAMPEYVPILKRLIE